MRILARCQKVRSAIRRIKTWGNVARMLQDSHMPESTERHKAH